ncbi:MAG: TIGR00300 family protein [candidate division Zixibacteria bacterium]|nr:TIGR00300 family protein [candidate division Zixibacteria bacterium]
MAISSKKRWFSREVTAVGHIVDSGIMSNILDKIIGLGGKFEITSFMMGKTNVDESSVKINVAAPFNDQLDYIIEQLHSLGCLVVDDSPVLLKKAHRNMVAPEGFYSTTNHFTEIYLNSKWRKVHNQRMDAVIVVKKNRAESKKLRDIRQGDQIVCGLTGIKITPEFKQRDRKDFEFMSAEISSEKKVELAVDGVASLLKKNGKKTAVVAGPVVIHTGAAGALSKLIKKGYVQALLSGNALAVHDIEQALYGTSLGVDTNTGKQVEGGHKNHIMAINQVYKHGSIKKMVKAGALKSGIMHTCIKHNIPFVLAGSLRDDGPLPETINDMVKAQAAYSRALKSVDMVIMLSTMLHSIATGNMIPAWIKTICVDINPSVVTKLADRGSKQTIGIVTDVGLFLKLLASRL